MRLVLLWSCFGAAACQSQTVSHVDPCSEAKPQAKGFSYGVAHVAGAYPLLAAGDSFLLEGAERVREFGVRTLKVYLTPNFRQKYKEAWPDDVRSVVTLAKTSQFQKLFAMDFDTFVVTTYTFANGDGGGFVDGATPAELDAEYNEMRALAEHLLKTYPSKRFILQNWESDWAVRPSAGQVAPELQKWIQARQQAVSDARAAIGGDNVLHAFEVNVVIDDNQLAAGQAKMVDAVLPNVCVDAVSYSSWESVIPMHSTSETVNDTMVKLTRAIKTIQSKMKKPALFYLGEIGFAETEMEEPRDARISTLLDQLQAAAPALGVESAIYWQIFDNECDEGCRGFYLVRPDGLLSSAGKAFRRMAR